MVRWVACCALLFAGCSSQGTSGGMSHADSGADGTTSRRDSGNDGAASRRDSTTDATTLRKDSSAPVADALVTDGGPRWRLPDGSLLYPDALPACSFPASLSPMDIPDGDTAVPGNTGRFIVASACCFTGEYPANGCFYELTAKVGSCGPAWWGPV